MNNFCNVLWSEQDAKGFRKVSLFNLEGTLSKREAFVSLYGGVAQLGEHLPCKQGVSGSIPLISTKGLKVNEERSRSLWPEEMGL